MGPLGYKYATHSHNLLSVPTTGLSLPPQFIHPIAHTAMFMRTILALSLAAFALAIPAPPPPSPGSGLPANVGGVTDSRESCLFIFYNKALIASNKATGAVGKLPVVNGLTGDVPLVGGPPPVVGPLPVGPLPVGSAPVVVGSAPVVGSACCGTVRSYFFLT